MLFGALAVTLHVVARRQLELGSGHQGVIWIAMLILGRTTSHLRWAGVTSAIGAGTTAMLPVWGLSDPLRWLAYLTAGATLDLGYSLFGRWRDQVWLLVVLGGLAHATKPLLRALISQASGWPYASLLWGVAHPASTHFIFGALGALLAAGLVRSFSRRSSPS